MNRLGREKSPYLLQHAHNPVDWHPWGEEAFALARRDNRPLFVSIGYSTCHWCHVMERESFEDSTVGAFLNAHFVSIKVDREERPDVDKIYMSFVQATTGSGGWPLNVFLTPDLKPFYGGTYFPPIPLHGRPSFLDILQRVTSAWRDHPGEVQGSAEQIHDRMKESLGGQTHGDHEEQCEPDGSAILGKGISLFKKWNDRDHGGFGGAPKFPQPCIPQCLLAMSKRFRDAEAARMVWHACDRMAAGGIHDHLGGGFARYAVDEAWLVPHFEKMLYDNAQLAQLYLDAWLTSGDSRHQAVVRDILDYVRRDMRHDAGGFYSAEDADSEGHEGKFYCWTLEELKGLLSPEELDVAVGYYGITEEGNFVDHSHPAPLRGQNVLHVEGVFPAKDPENLRLLESANHKMREARRRRIRPHLDDKVLASWNGLMLGAFARAGCALGEPAYIETAIDCASFIKSRLWDEKNRRLCHRWRDGETDKVELLEGYAFVLAGVIQLYEATLDACQLDFAISLAQSMLDRFEDSQQGGFWQAPADCQDLILRIKDADDGAEPSGNSMAVLALLKLGEITDQPRFTRAAESALKFFAGRMESQPHSMSVMLQALDFHTAEKQRVVVGGDPATPQFKAMIRAAHAVYAPEQTVMGTAGAVHEFAGSQRTTAVATAWVCKRQSCLAPVNDPGDLLKILRA